jgi:cadmium resistance protein CadD (predicted permease)
LDLIALIGIGVAAFVATNIDDLLILVVFFAAIPRFSIFQIVLGQYAGMGSLIAISLLGSLISLVIPTNLIGLIGFFPIAIGVKELLELSKKNGNKDKDNEKQKILTKQQPHNKTKYLPFLTVAAVTFSGGEEIGIYASLFATNNEAQDIIVLVSVVMVLTAFWCFMANYLVRQSFLAEYIRHIGRRALPFLLIGLGIYILAEAYLTV